MALESRSRARSDRDPEGLVSSSFVFSSNEVVMAGYWSKRVVLVLEIERREWRGV